MVEGIPGSSPDWRGANMKTKGRAVPTDIPPSKLGSSATGLATWSTCSSPDAHQPTRRHFHTSQLSQTTAWDCLPCVDAAHQQAAASTAKPAMGCTTSTTEPSTSLALANQPWRRHRREVPAPPCLDKPQGKRMLHTAPPSTCKELLQDPQTTQHLSTAPVAAPAPVAVQQPAHTSSRPGKDSMAACATKGVCTAAAAAPLAAGGTPPERAGGRVSTAVSAAEPPTSSAAAASNKPDRSCSGGQPAVGVHQSLDLDCMQHNGGSSRNKPGSQGRLGSCQQPAVGKKAGRVEDDPNYFRTPKDPPTLQRFTAAMAQMSVGKESRAAQRHEAGIRARQQAQLAAIAREVAALDAGTGPDVD